MTNTDLNGSGSPICRIFKTGRTTVVPDPLLVDSENTDYGYRGAVDVEEPRERGVNSKFYSDFLLQGGSAALTP